MATLGVRTGALTATAGRAFESFHNKILEKEA